MKAEADIALKLPAERSGYITSLTKRFSSRRGRAALRRALMLLPGVRSWTRRSAAPVQPPAGRRHATPRKPAAASQPSQRPSSFSFTRAHEERARRSHAGISFTFRFIVPPAAADIHAGFDLKPGEAHCTRLTLLSFTHYSRRINKANQSRTHRLVFAYNLPISRRMMRASAHTRYAVGISPRHGRARAGYGDTTSLVGTPIQMPPFCHRHDDNGVLLRLFT